MSTIFSLIVLIFSVIVHEVAHGLMADKLGDPTARLQGRLTLNPVKHIDPVGSILVPIITSLSGFAFGWAKPVPFNPYNLKDRRQGEFLIALAGPASNIVLALIFGLIIRYGAVYLGPQIFTAFTYIVIINLALAVFNLIPLPPMDGSKLLFAYLPARYAHIRASLEQYGFVSMLIVVLVLWKFISPLVWVLFNIITGVRM